MSRERAIVRAEQLFDNDSFFKLLARRLSHPTESQNSGRAAALRDYLTGEMISYLETLGFVCRVAENPVSQGMPFLIGERIESAERPTCLTYGHADTVLGMEGEWRQGLEPWKLTREGDRWYGRGAADNKGQHAINLAALDCVLKERSRLGFNAKILLETGEEMGSPGLREICSIEKEALSADVLIASDGPRVDPEQPTIFGGSRGVFNFDLRIKLRDGGHHSGNWGGLLANPGIILANALASLVDPRGRILLGALKPERIPDPVKRSLAKIEVTGRKGPDIDPEWGEPGLSLAEKVYGWNSLEIIAFKCGNPAAPAHAIPPEAWARCHLRYVADTDPERFMPAIRKHLDENGFEMIELTQTRKGCYPATRMEPDDPWIEWAVSSLKHTTGKAPVFLPNLGGTLPNDAFRHILGLPTVWIPHSYGGCSQHAPNEHLLAPVVRDSLRLMTGLFWDLGENPPRGFNSDDG